MDVTEKVDMLPAAPGVYMLKDGEGRILYIGKAKNLRSRVRSYFHRSGDTRYAVRFLVDRTRDIDWMVTANEKEALILEDRLLKMHRPRYNIRLKDDKTYVSIKITVNERFPRILVTRRVRRDGARYFGPYASARQVRETIKFLRRIFPLCVCSPAEFRNRRRPCLDHQLGLCSSPATGHISEKDYGELVKGAVMFLEGRNTELVKGLKRSMEEAARRLDFERAAALRDRMAAIESMLEEQSVVSRRDRDRDVFAVAEAGGRLVVKGLFVRRGVLIGGVHYELRSSGLPLDEVVGSFVTAYYRGERFIPDEVIVPVPVEGGDAAARWLTERRGRKVEVICPRRGERKRLVEMAEVNARSILGKERDEAAARLAVLEALGARLRLGAAPRVIEAFDISNLGDEAVGAMVTFVDGEPCKDRYRLYRIGSRGPDDYAMMHEVLTRRLRNADEPAADLVLIDGGKGQLNMALRAAAELGVTGLRFAALAKDRPQGKAGRRHAAASGPGERVYLPGRKDPVALRRGSPEDLLLMRIRDEVHRFAVGYLRRRRRRTVGSALDGVRGVGVKRRRALLERFGSVEAVAAASLEELCAVPGMTRPAAEAVHAALRRCGEG